MDLLPGKPGDCGVTAKGNRLFTEAVLWMGRTGAPWRDLPPKFGPWHNVYVRFARWRDKGVWQRISTAVSQDPDMEELMIDSTIVRAHQHAAGAQKKSGAQAIGRSRGGPSTKIHAAVDALGNPVRVILTAGQQADITQADALIAGFVAESVLADKGYDADAFVVKITSQGAHAVIPPRSNRTEQRSVDWHVYKDRNLVERFFNRLKQFRRVATRYDKLDTSFLCFILLACSVIWLL